MELITIKKYIFCLILVSALFTKPNFTFASDNLKTGYQWQKTDDFSITETNTGMLKTDKTLEIYISDGIGDFDSISFSNDFTIETNSESGIQLSAPQIIPFENKNKIVITILKQSTKVPATIKFTNIHIKTDRLVAESNDRSYKIVVSGNAVAESYYKNININDKLSEGLNQGFNIEGIGIDYTGVTDSSLNSQITVKAFSDEILVGRYNNNPKKLSSKTYIDTDTNILMVPLRSMLQSFSFSSDKILWDQEDETVTIMNGSRVIQFKKDSSEFIVNGITSNLYNEDNTKKVSTAIKDSEFFVPYNLLAVVFGIPVKYDLATNIAVYNYSEVN